MVVWRRAEEVVWRAALAVVCGVVARVPETEMSTMTLGPEVVRILQRDAMWIADRRGLGRPFPSPTERDSSASEL